MNMWMGQQTRTRVNLAANESPVPPGRAAVRAAEQALRLGHLYPTGQALAEFERHIGQLHGVHADRVATGPGLTEVLGLVARCYAGPGTEILAPEYSFLLYRMASAMVGADYKAAPVDGYRADLQTLSTAIGPRTQLVFVANPNNPTGLALRPEAVESFLRAVPRRVTVVIDEAYGDFSPASVLPKPGSQLARFPNLIIARTFSKAWGLAGLRLGYLLLGDDARERFSRQLLPFRVSSVALAAGLAALQHDLPRLERVVALNQQVRALYYALFERTGVEYLRSEANFVTALLGSDAPRVMAGLKEAQIDVCHLGMYGLKQAIRVSTGTVQEANMFAACLERLRRPTTLHQAAP